MTDREIVERLARDVMGWEQLPAGTPSGFVRFDLEHMGYAIPNDHSCFVLNESDADAYVYQPNVGSFDVWKPLNRIADAWMLVERLAETPRNLTFRMVAYPYSRTYANFFENEVYEEANGDNHTARAICMAALATLEEQPRP